MNQLNNKNNRFNFRLVKDIFKNDYLKFMDFMCRKCTSLFYGISTPFCNASITKKRVTEKAKVMKEKAEKFEKVEEKLPDIYELFEQLKRENNYHKTKLYELYNCDINDNAQCRISIYEELNFVQRNVLRGE